MSGTSKSGRRKKPTAELEALGSWRAKERVDEPTCIDIDVDPPDWLNGEARNYWDTYYPMLRATGILSAADAGPFMMLCRIWSQWRDTEKLCRERGEDMPVKDYNGKVTGAKRAPWEMRRRDLQRQYFSACEQFGLTPSSRSRVTAMNRDDGETEDCIT